MGKKILIEIKENELKTEFKKEDGKKTKKVFEIKHRKQNLTKSQLKNSHSYLKNPYWENGGPCPPGIYYLFYRYRMENGKKRERLEFCQTKPNKLIINEDDKKNTEILKKQGCLKFKSSPDRINIQIHGGSKSKGCFIIKNSKDFYKIIKIFLEDGCLVKVKVDDYWKTQEGKKEIKKSAIG